MDSSALLGSAAWSLLRNKLRSSLTVLGITIGIAAVICVVAIGQAGQERVEQQLNALGDNFVWIEAGGRAVNGVRTGNHGTNTLTLADAVADQGPGADDQERVAQRRRLDAGRLRQPELVHRLPRRLAGVLRHQALGGSTREPPSPRTTSTAPRTSAPSAARCAISSSASRTRSARYPRLHDMPCRVVATLLPKGLSVSGQDQDDTILMPYTTVQKKIKGVTWLDDILCSAVSPEAS